MIELGVDVSKWQGKMDWKKAADAGAKFGIIRAGSCDNITGENYTDFQFERNSSEAHAFVRTGYYWYFRPNFNAEKQADYFTKLISTKVYNEPLAADFEFSGGRSPIEVCNAQLAFLKRLTSNGVLLSGGDIYTRTSFWNVAVAPHSDWKKYGLHIARYVLINSSDKPIMQGPWSDGKFKIRDWSEWKRWQFSADGNGRGKKYGAESDAIDLNIQIVPNVSTPVPDNGTVQMPKELALSIKDWISEALD